MMESALEHWVKDVSAMAKVKAAPGSTNRSVVSKDSNKSVLVLQLKANTAENKTTVNTTSEAVLSKTESNATKKTNATSSKTAANATKKAVDEIEANETANKTTKALHEIKESASWW